MSPIVHKVIRNLTCTPFMFDTALVASKSYFDIFWSTPNWTYITNQIINIIFLLSQFTFCFILNTLLVWKLYAVLVCFRKLLNMPHFSASQWLHPDMGSIGMYNRKHSVQKGCKVCKEFMVSPLTIESYHTDQQFKFKHILDCKLKFVIYKIDDKICKRCYVGSTAIGVSERWRNHKSHIRNNIKSCELSTPFLSVTNTILIIKLV